MGRPSTWAPTRRPCGKPSNAVKLAANAHQFGTSAKAKTSAIEPDKTRLNRLEGGDTEGICLIQNTTKPDRGICDGHVCLCAHGHDKPDCLSNHTRNRNILCGMPARQAPTIWADREGLSHRRTCVRGQSLGDKHNGPRGLRALAPRGPAKNPLHLSKLMREDDRRRTTAKATNATGEFSTTGPRLVSRAARHQREGSASKRRAGRPAQTSMSYCKCAWHLHSPMNAARTYAETSMAILATPPRSMLPTGSSGSTTRALPLPLMCGRCCGIRLARIAFGSA